MKEFNYFTASRADLQRFSGVCKIKSREIGDESASAYLRGAAAAVDALLMLDGGEKQLGFYAKVICQYGRDEDE